MSERVFEDEALSPDRLDDLDEQVAEQVCNLELSALMTSGAGCGKTYQMVQRYLAIIRADVPVTEIIAVTFTEKAAAELKDRVREKCRELMATETLTADERARWERAARRLAMAPISTIHGLCSRLLRENAIAAGVDPRFVQLDETQQGQLLSDAVRETLLARLHAREPTAERMLGRWELGEACEILEGLIDDRERLARLLEAPPDADTLLARWRRFAEEKREELLGRALAHEWWTEPIGVLRAVASPPPGDKATERRAAVLEHAARAEDTDLDAPRRVEALLGLFGEVSRHKVGAQGNWEGRLAELEAAREAFRALADLKDEFRGMLEALEQVEGPETAELAAAIAAEATRANEAYSGAKRERSTLDFADLQLLARDLLASRRDVLARVQDRYRYVLVDEFQDTNDLQKEIIWRIAGADPEIGAPPPGGRLFVVGDAKQSIYGFRNADVTVFNATCADFRACEDTAQVISLPATRRSHPGLVRLFNDIFSEAAVMGTECPTAYEAEYEPVRAARPEHPVEVDAELLLIREGLLGEEDEDATRRDARIVEAEQIARRIREIHESGMQVSDRDEDGTPIVRQIEWGDFGILFRAMTSVGIYEYALRNEGVPFYTVAGRGFYNRQEIRDCLALLRLLENTSDEIALAGALRSPMFGVSDDTLLWLCRGRETLMSALRAAADGDHPEQDHFGEKQTVRLRRACEVIDRLGEVRNRATLSELTERIVAETGLGAVHLTQFGGRQAAANLSKLTDLARAFEERGQFSLRAFIDWLDELFLTEHREGLADVYEESADVVKLMTVHKSKGLEWPVVIVPDLGRGTRGSREAVISDSVLGPVPKLENEFGEESWGAIGEMLREREKQRDEAEARRLLYVALTRARDMLLMSSPMGITSKGKLSAGQWLKWLFEALGLDAEGIEDEMLLGGERWRCRVRAPRASEETASPSAGLDADRAPLSLIDEALADAARERQPFPERVRPVAPDALERDAFPVTALQHYRDCPRRFYLRHVLDFEETGPVGDWLQRLSAVERGNMAHRALEVIGRRGLHADAVDEALTMLAASHDARIGEDELARLRESLRWYLHEARVGDERIYEQWVAGAARLRAEADFVAPLSGVRVEGKIDALAEDASGAWRIVDYKTGEASEDRRDGYRFQLGIYCAAVREITGGLPVDAAVVLLDGREVLRLEPRVEADRALEDAERIIGGIVRGEFARVEDCRREACRLAYACQLA